MWHHCTFSSSSFQDEKWCCSQAEGRFKTLFEIQTYLRHQTEHKQGYSRVQYLPFYLQVTSKVLKSTVDISAAICLSVCPTEQTLQYVIKPPKGLKSKCIFTGKEGKTVTLKQCLELALSVPTLAILSQNLSIRKKGKLSRWSKTTFIDIFLPRIFCKRKKNSPQTSLFSYFLMFETIHFSHEWCDIAFVTKSHFFCWKSEIICIYRHTEEHGMVHLV